MITNNEYEILLALWKADHALSAKEILDMIENKTFKDRTIHSLLNAMLEKGLISVDGHKLSSRIYSRCFKANISFEDYHAGQIKDNSVYRQGKGRVLPGIVSALIDDDDVSAETLNKLEQLLEEKRKQLNHETDHL